MKKYLSLIMMGILLISTMAFLGNILPVRAGTTYYVSTTGSDVTGDGSSGNPWRTIQYAVNHAGSGDTIMVAAGTYDEQVVVGTSLTLEGSGVGTVVAPNSSSLTALYDSHWFGNGMVAGIIVANAGGGSVTVENLTVDGSGITTPPAGADNVAGIFYLNTGGTIDTVTVENIAVGVGGTSLRGYGIILSAKTSPVSVEVRDSTLTDFDKNGIDAEGSDLTVNIHDNAVTGRGPTLSGDEVQNGILVENGATGTVDHNTISNLAYSPLTWWACGIMFYDAGGSADSNSITNCQIGILFQDGNGSATDNTVDGGTVGLLGLYAQYYTAGTWTMSFTRNTVTGHIENIPGYVNEAIGAATYASGACLTITIDGNQLTYGSASADGLQIGDTVADGAAGSIAAAIIYNNISNWPNGIEFYDTIDYTDTYVMLNNIAGNTVYGITNSNTTPGGTIWAEENWWGDATGPGPVGPGVGDKVSPNVDYANWLEEAYSSTKTYADYKSTIVKAADRLVALQSSTDYGWDWDVTGLTSHSASPSATNLFGVTALSLLDAYVKTDDPTYLNAAESTASFIKYGDASAGDFWYGHDTYYWGFSFDYKFLTEFSPLWGDSSYSDYALAAWNWEKTNIARYADGNQGMIWDRLVNQWVGTGYYGYGAWQASDYGLAAWEMGDTLWAQQMADIISANVANIALPFTAPYIATNYTNDQVNLGMAWALKLLVTVNATAYASSIATLENQLLSNQLIDGAWDFNSVMSPGDVQTTAYAVIALWTAGEYDAARRGADWLVSTQLSNGGWSEFPDEYSEIDSEALQAIVTAIPAYVYTIPDYENAIASSADRLVALQSPTDFGWDWYVTGLTSHSAGASATNLYGVTAISLIEAYLKTGNSTYLTAAENTADFMMYGDPSSGDFYNGYGTYNWGRSSDYTFLMELSAVTGNTTYSDYALAAWAWQKANATDTRLGGSGQLAYADGNQSILYYDYTNYWIGTGCYGIASWEASDWGLAALAMGDTSWARDMADVINANVANIALPYTPPYIATNYTYDYVNMGIAWALMLLVKVDPVAYASSITTLENQLLSNQLSDGSWSNWFLNTAPGESQTTAYAVMALNAAHDYAAARKGADWLVAMQFNDGGWSSSPSEYSEPDSEDLQALASTIPQLTVTSAYDSPTPSGTTTYFAGTNITASVTSPISGPSGTQYVCTGWTGTGDVQASGSGTTMTFTISQDSSITWNWKTQYYLTVISPYDTPGGTGWYDSGATAYATLTTGTVPIVPGYEQAVFTGWIGDASGTGLTSNPITMNGPKTAVADWKIQFFLQVVTNPSNVTTIPGEGWYDNWTYVSLTATQYVPNAAGINGVRYNFTYWDVDGVSQGAGNNPISVHMNTNHTATAYFTLQYLIAFNQTAVGSDFTGTVVIIDGSNYAVNGLPASFWYDAGTTHTFAFQSPLPVGLGAKLYYWMSTSGLSASQLGSIAASSSGTVTGNYVTKIHDVAVTSVLANRTWVYQGWPVGMNVTILDNGNFTETVNVTVYYNLTHYNTTGIVGTQNVTLLAGQSETIAFTWDTTSVQPHYYYNYTLTAVASIPADFTPADNTLTDGDVTVRMMFDVNGDGKIDGRDITLAARAFGSYGPNFLHPGSPPSQYWNPDVDFNRDNKVDGRDLTMIAKHFGEHYPP